MTIYIIGLGVDRRIALPKEIINNVRRCRYVYWENYTSPSPYSYEDLVDLFNREDIIEISRRNLEDGLDDLLKHAKEHDIAILVNGDPLIATTHINIIIEASKNGIDYEIYHSSSILSAGIGESGLHTYKFGLSGTIVREEVASNSRNIEILKFNLENGLHTFYYLEYDKDSGYIMPIDYAINILKKYADDVLKSKNPYLIVLCGIGYDKPYRIAFKYNEIEHVNIEPNMKKPCILIVTGKLHYMEEEYIKEVLKGS